MKNTPNFTSVSNIEDLTSLNWASGPIIKNGKEQPKSPFATDNLKTQISLSVYFRIIYIPI